jgi:Na+/H+ antiporter NhaD/arsenite permease-like protein
MKRTKLYSFLRTEPVLSVSFLAAAVSCFIVRPDAGYLDYIDIRTLVLLYCLMTAVSGLRRSGLFRTLAYGLCARAGNMRRLCTALTMLCFLTSMLVTNDVALLAFVPFTTSVYGMAGRKRELAATVVLETAAANLGSMLTPVGNPQNIYLFSKYAMTAGEFFSATGPVCAVSAALLLLLCLASPSAPVNTGQGAKPELSVRKLALAAALLGLCMLCVFRVIPWWVLLPCVAAALLIFDRWLLREADFLLLLTFVCFFVFAGNMGRIPSVESLVRSSIGGREMLVSAAASQFISNVPAAVLLSGFTENGRALLLGTDIGGLGTPAASLASLISLRLYAMTDGAEPGKYLLLFSVINFALLAVLLIFADVFLI